MRMFTGGVAHIAHRIEEDLSDRETGLQKPHVPALTDLVACALSTRCATPLSGWPFCPVKLTKKSQKNALWPPTPKPPEFLAHV